MVYVVLWIPVCAWPLLESSIMTSLSSAVAVLSTLVCGCNIHIASGSQNQRNTYVTDSIMTKLTSPSNRGKMLSTVERRHSLASACAKEAPRRSSSATLNSCTYVSEQTTSTSGNTCVTYATSNICTVSVICRLLNY